MIRYDVTAPALRKSIEAHRPGWLKRAADRTERFRKLGRYAEEVSIWSEVKPVYMRLQGDSKCAFCERQLESDTHGKGEQDVEHFRPKGNVKPWPVPKELAAAGVKVSRPPSGKGYHLLAYHPLNYSAACGPCNQVLKRDYFPIAGTYDLAGEDPSKLREEKPLLIYPLGRIDSDPESLISFYGVSPRPVARSGHDRHRALVTIHLLDLDNVLTRKSLIRDRARSILALYPQLEKAAAGIARAADVASTFLRPTAPHANCARSFKRLFDRNRDEARALFNLAEELILRMS